MSSIILHISDLHVSLDKKIGGERNSHDSYLDTSNENEPSILYIDKFIDTIKRDFNHNEINVYLIVTGDITNEGEKKEFDYAYLYLSRIIESLKIDKSNILLIPGDHDLNRRSITNLLAENEESSLESINEAKYYNFKEFYIKLLEKEFNPNKIIFDKIKVDN